MSLIERVRAATQGEAVKPLHLHPSIIGWASERMDSLRSEPTDREGLTAECAVAFQQATGPQEVTPAELAEFLLEARGTDDENWRALVRLMMSVATG